jgi:carbon storage regulator
MLVLTRKVGERIIIDDYIVIEVLDTQKSRIKVGIHAPPHVKVLRQEVLARSGVQEQDRDRSREQR